METAAKREFGISYSPSTLLYFFLTRWVLMRKFYKSCIDIVRQELSGFENVKVDVILRKALPKAPKPNFPTSVCYVMEGEDGYRIIMHEKAYEIATRRKGDLDSIQHRFGDFLKGIGLQLDEKTYFLLILLHEFGHVYRLEFFKMNDISREFFFLNNIAIQSLSLAFDDGAYEELFSEGINVANIFSFDEVGADNYALKHFIPMWKKLEGRGLV